MMRTLGFATAVLLIGAFALFVVQNLGETTLRFITWDVNLSLAVPVVAAYVLGGLTARPVLRFLNSQRKSRRVEKNAIKAAEKKLRSGSPPADKV